MVFCSVCSFVWVELEGEGLAMRVGCRELVLQVRCNMTKLVNGELLAKTLQGRPGSLSNGIPTDWKFCSQPIHSLAFIFLLLVDVSNFKPVIEANFLYGLIRTEIAKVIALVLLEPVAWGDNECRPFPRVGIYEVELL